MAKIRQLVHNGVLIPQYEPRGFKILYKKKRLCLTSKVEEMAVSWVKKLETDYVKDPVFIRNFVSDFSKALGVDPGSEIEDFDFSEIQRWVEHEKAKRESMSREERKALAEVRKKVREANKEKYGYAMLNGERVEIGNYTVEPSCVFLGRGKHPLRGRWKQGATYEDVTLNLSPDAPTPELPEGRHWGGRVFDPEALWVAKWRDKLSGEMKYVWIADTARFKQEREIEKFDRARDLKKVIGKVRRYIERHLSSEDPLMRKIATVAYLIDTLKLRVGDEKEKDELDTVGATTLRGSHVKIDDTGTVKFDFLGKDAVRWVVTIKLPAQVVENLRSFIKGPGEQIFSGVRSEHVNDFLSQVMPGLTAKVFRTYHASKTVEEHLSKKHVEPGAPEFEKRHVSKMANLQAAVICHHKRKLPKNWERSFEHKVERLRKLQGRLKEVRRKPKTERRARRMERLKEQIRNVKLQIELAKETRDYNLGTSLKSYIDPRVFVRWAEKVGYDWKRIYPKTLQRKFAWAENSGSSP